MYPQTLKLQRTDILAQLTTSAMVILCESGGRRCPFLGHDDVYHNGERAGAEEALGILKLGSPHRLTSKIVICPAAPAGEE